ncbi:uncharacterized protein LOC122498119 [Leptopilina heterotoma]|uniref:uncharacterized protein LOC122498119 n=1 Tax=Leptopilina heterotoma TaxID=63436 RepID=UPI001CAA3584|nr:uncharacterized protein LOC122498119 [Leptopilina heterotoma]
MESEFLKLMDERKNARHFSRLKNPLEKSLQFGSIVEIQDILREKYAATLSPENDWAKKCRQIINICLDKKLNVNMKSTYYFALLQFVIKHLDEDFESVFKKCEKFNINACNYLYNNYGTKSLLHFAIKLRKQNVVKILIEFGAKVDVRDGNKQTPLFHAVQTKQTEIAEMLLKAGANVNAKDYCNMMPINFAFGEREDTSSNEKYKPSKLVTLLCSYGAELNFKNCGSGNTLVAACEIGNLKEMEFLIEHGADLLSTDEYGRTAINRAAIKYNYNIVDFLLRQGVDINVKDIEYQNTIHELSNTKANIKRMIANAGDNTYEAISVDWNLNFISDEVKKSAEMIEFLTDNGADINSLDYQEVTPLMISVETDALEITECLLELNATIYEHKVFFMRGRMFPHVLETTDFSSNGINTWAVITAYSALKNISAYEKFPSEHFKWIHSLFEECKEEVIKMRGKKIWADRKVSFFDFLNKDLMDVTKFFRNCEIMSVLKSDKYDEFPCYAYLFEKRMERVQKMKHCQNVFIRFLKEFFKRNLPTVAVDKIMNYLTAGDLRNFGRALCITKKTPNQPSILLYPNPMAYSLYYYNRTMESEFLEIMDEKKNEKSFVRGKNPLERALQFGSIVEIQDILREKYAATLSPENDWAKKCRQIINICLDKKLNVNMKETNYCALLHFVMKHLDEDFESVFKKCEKFDINACNNPFYMIDIYISSELMSLLHFAIEERKRNVVKALIEFGADVDVKDGLEQTPLFYAVKTKQTEIAEMLLKAGANVNAEDSNNMMPINFAFGEREDTSSNEKYKPSKLVTLLCSYGAELNFKTNGGGNTLVAACKIGNLKEIEFLIEHGADLLSTDEYGRTALNLAAVKYNYNLVDFLLCRGVNINNYNYEGGSVIQHLSKIVDNIREATFRKRDNSYEVISIDWNLDFIGDEVKKAAEMIEFLADNGAELNTLDDENITPLMTSIRFNALEITECLLELNAKLYYNDDHPIYVCDGFNSNVDTEFHSNNITTWVLLTAFLALKNIDIKNYSYSQYINFDSVFSFYEKCKEEIIKMEERRIWADREVSFFDFLNEDLLKVTKYFRNCDVMYVLESDKYDEFSGYKYLFEKRIQRVEKMKNCQNVFIRFMKEFFKRNLPSVVIDEIMNYLSAGDFRNFGRALCITEKSPNGKYFI